MIVATMNSWTIMIIAIMFFIFVWPVFRCLTSCFFKAQAWRSPRNNQVQVHHQRSWSCRVRWEKTPWRCVARKCHVCLRELVKYCRTMVLFMFFCLHELEQNRLEFRFVSEQPKWFQRIRCYWILKVSHSRRFWRNCHGWLFWWQLLDHKFCLHTCSH